MSRENEPVPEHFDAGKVGEVWRTPYQQLAESARNWAKKRRIPPAENDPIKTCLLLIDVQNTFCLPGFELFVAGPSGDGAVQDNRRLCRFIYRNLSRISHITATMDTHQAMQIFHSLFFIDAEGNHPPVMTMISSEDILKGRWQFNPALAKQLRRTPEEMREFLIHYTRELEKTGKYLLTIWPYHAMLGGIGHALASAVEEAIFFHTIARQRQARIITKGSHPLTEHYSAFRPEVQNDPQGKPLVDANQALFRELMEYDALIIAGQAKSHCVAWTVADLLTFIRQSDPALADKVYLLDDCASPVCIPGVVDFSEAAENAYREFAEAGMHRVNSTDPMHTWPGPLSNL